MDDTNPFQSPENTDSRLGNGRRWWQAEVPPNTLLLLFVLGVAQYRGIGLLIISGVVGDPQPLIHFAMYFVHWSSVGGVIGSIFSKSGTRASLIGAVTGLILAAALMQ